MEIDKRIYNGARAREVLENEVFNSAFADMKKEITEQWMTSPARDQEGREKLWGLLKLTEKFEAIIKTTIETGKLAEIDLKYQKSVLYRAKEWIG